MSGTRPAIGPAALGAAYLATCPPHTLHLNTHQQTIETKDEKIKEIKCGKLRCIEQQFPSIYKDWASAVCIRPGDMGSRVSLALFSVI